MRTMSQNEYMDDLCGRIVCPKCGEVITEESHGGKVECPACGEIIKKKTDNNPF